MFPSRSHSRLAWPAAYGHCLGPCYPCRSRVLKTCRSNSPVRQLDPLVELFLPPTGSPDRIRFVREGMLIEQRADVPERPTGVSGFKTSLLASGDFTVTFDFKCLRLDETTEGWGQGLALAVFLDDEKQIEARHGPLGVP